MHVLGPRQGRSREAYPTPPGAGGAQAKLVPLTRQRFIDGGTIQTGLDGSVANPFKTIAQFMASRTDASAADAAANYVGWLMPALAGYTENVAFPAYCSTELRADSVTEATRGAVINGNVTWANIAGAFASDQTAVCSIHNVQVQGTMTITDDAGAPVSIFMLSFDEFPGGISGGSGLASNTTTKLTTVFLKNAVIDGDVNCGTASTSANLTLSDGSLIGSGSIQARAVVSRDSTLAVTAITTNAVAGTGLCEFFNTIFGDNAVLTTPLAVFDGFSWSSFLEIGGTRAAGTVVTVVGGFDGAAVAGADLPTTGTNTDVSLNGTGATAGYTAENSGNQYIVNGLAADGGSVTLKTGGGELKGDTICITKQDFAAHAYAIKNNAAATIASITSGQQGFVVARFDGSDWVFDRGGSLGT